MKIISSRNLLNDAVSMAQKAISTRSTVPILEGILAEADENGLTLTGYDMETGIECKVDAEVIEPGSIVINARMLGDIVRKLPDDTVTLETDEKQIISITCGRSSFKIRGLNAGEYPKIPIVEEAKQLVLPQQILKDMITQTIFSVSNDPNRPILNGIKVTVKENALELVAIDGYRLALRREVFDDKLPEMQFIVPTKTMHEASRILVNVNEDVKIYPSHNHILFDTGTVKMVSRLLQGEYMQYESIIPTSAMTQMFVETKPLLSAIERAALVVDVENRRFPINVKNEDDSHLLISARTDVGQAKEDVMMEKSGEDIDYNYDPRYLNEALKAIPDEKIRLQFNGQMGPCLLLPEEGDSFLYLVLPVRV